MIRFARRRRALCAGRRLVSAVWGSRGSNVAPPRRRRLGCRGPSCCCEDPAALAQSHPNEHGALEAAWRRSYPHVFDDQHLPTATATPLV